jgi:hypothetical protein
MGTKLDQNFANGIREGVNALILEVERLFWYCMGPVISLGVDPETFSCAAFEKCGPSNTKGDE